jgi:predicted nucleotidyltransferase
MPECDRSRLTIPQRYPDMILRILDELVPEAEVWAYGSRVEGSCHEASDFDLKLRNPTNLETPLPKLFELRAAFTESNIPIRVDVMDWARIPESFRREISRRYARVRGGARSSVGRHGLRRFAGIS